MIQSFLPGWNQVLRQSLATIVVFQFTLSRLLSFNLLKFFFKFATQNQYTITKVQFIPLSIILTPSSDIISSICKSNTHEELTQPCLTPFSILSYSQPLDLFLYTLQYQLS